MTRYVGGQSQVFMGVVQDVARARPPVWKCIDPDSSIFAAIKQVSPGTVTIARIYTGAPVVDDESKYTAAYIYGRNYADLVYSRVLDPAHTDYIESENEPNDHYGDLTRFIQRLNAFLVGFGERAKQLGFRPIGPNFSVGYPEVYVPGADYELWPNAWAGLADGLRAIKAAGGALGLHEYSAPDMFNGWSDAKQLGYLAGRHKAIYRCLPADLQDMPLYLTEYGIDWLISPYNQQGGFWHNRDENAPTWYVDQLRQAWDRIYKTTPQLRGACHFIHGNNNAALWEEYDTTRTDTARQIFVDFMREELPAQVVPPVAPPTGGGMARTAQDRLNAAWRAVGIVYNPDAAFPKEAQKLGLGRPVTNEYRDMTARPAIAGQGFDNAFLECVEGDWSHMTAYDWLTGEVYSAPVPPTPQPGGLPPYVFPPILTAAGFIGIEGHPAAGHTFYRVAPQATVRLGVSAFCDVTVLGPGGVPAIGVQVVSMRADGKGEILSTDGGGKVRFYFGAGSAFTPPARPPFEVFMAEGAVKDEDTKLISVALQVSDSVCVGDTRGEHTETYLQFVGYAM